MSIKQGELANTIRGNSLDKKAVECTNCGRQGHTKERCWAKVGGLAGQKLPIKNSLMQDM